MELQLLGAVLGGIVLLLLLILYFRLQAFLALLISSMAVGLFSGMPLEQVIISVQNGMAGTLGFIALVVGLGAMFGAILEHSGGINALAAFILNRAGEKHASWALVCIGFLVSIPVFFDVGFIILVPVIYALQHKTGQSILVFGIPLLAGLAVTHSFIPPTPGPVAVAEIIGAELGRVILIGILAGIPAAVLSGPLFGKYIGKRIFRSAPEFDLAEQTQTSLPDAGMIFLMIGLPLFLILLNTTVESGLVPAFLISDDLRSVLIFTGHPFVALVTANLLAWYFLGIRKGISSKELMEVSTKSLSPAGLIILITGAGGVFKEMLTDTGAGEMIARSLMGMGLSMFFFAFLAAALIRILQGSATVAMITAASLTASLVSSAGFSEMDKALLVIAIASGSSILSHVNDSGFWLVNRYFGLTEKQTLQSWTVMTTILALSGFASVLILRFFFS